MERPIDHPPEPSDLPSHTTDLSPGDKIALGHEHEHEDSPLSDAYTHLEAGQSSASELSPVREEFLEEQYLAKPYIVPPDIEEIMREAAHSLETEVSGISCVVNVGGTANGSLALRRIEGRKTATDLDFYFVGDGDVDVQTLSRASEIVAQAAIEKKVTPDGILNGRNLENYLNLDAIDEHIASGDFNLLALPFQSAFGNVAEAQRRVLEAVIRRPDSQEVWDEIANGHTQSLSMHHGSWSPRFSNTILERYFMRKVQLFELPDTPEQALQALEPRG